MSWPASWTGRSCFVRALWIASAGPLARCGVAVVVVQALTAARAVPRQTHIFITRTRAFIRAHLRVVGTWLRSSGDAMRRCVDCASDAPFIDARPPCVCVCRHHHHTGCGVRPRWRAEATRWLGRLAGRLAGHHRGLAQQRRAGNNNHNNNNNFGGGGGGTVGGTRNGRY